jgi:glycosidase
MDFWVAFREATKRAKPESFTVGEATDTPDSLRRFAQRLDAILDFPLARALRSTFALGSWDVAQLDRFLNAYEAFMETGPFRVSFLDNHDMDRFLFVAGGDTTSLKLAALCQFALEPTPAIYYGTEVALHQDAASSDQASGGDSQVRHDMVWDETQWNMDVLDFYRRLVHARRETPALRRGARHTIHLDADAGTYAFIREAPSNDATPAVAAFNLSNEAQTIDISDLSAGAFRVLVSTAGPSDETGHAKILLAPRSAAICVGEKP